MSLAEELTMLRKRVKDQDKEIRRLKEENEFLEEASAFFAASRRKSLRPKVWYRICILSTVLSCRVYKIAKKSISGRTGYRM